MMGASCRMRRCRSKPPAVSRRRRAATQHVRACTRRDDAPVVSHAASRRRPAGRADEAARSFWMPATAAASGTITWSMACTT